MPFDPATGAYVDTRVARGFPMGGIGAGGFGFDADGSFGELRLNNNWMCPVRGARGCFHALFTRRGSAGRMIMLRRASDEREYDGVRNVRSTRFVGLLPAFTLAYDDDLPLRVELAGFTPHVPHDVRESTLPAAVFRFRLDNPGDEPVTASVLFSFENVLGRGGSGNLGLVLGPEHEVRGVRERVVYDSVAGNFQEEVAVGGRHGVRFRTAQRWDERSHRRGVTGEYLLLADGGPGIDVTWCDAWNADEARPALLDDFARDGRIRSRDTGRRGEDGVYRPAAAVAAAVTLVPGATRDVVFALAWWTPDHVTEPDLARDRPHGGVRVGHVYERWFRGPDDVARHLLDERERLEAASTELPRLVADSSLPGWLARAIVNSIDSTLCNSIVPRSGALHTLEGMDWRWPMGGLTGTMDQRLSAHPYTSVFFTELDVRELAEFRALADGRGAIPHGNGNSDLALGSTDVPYGWPLYVKDFLPAKEWTDLTMSFVLQVGKLWRLTGDRALLEPFWPALVRGMEYLDALAPRGVPEGGTTYDVWDFPGAFIYTATVYLATLATMIDVASRVEPALVERYRERSRRCARRIDDDLWNPRGYFQTTETHDTIFTAALAGDWAARYAGLPPVVDPARAASHLRHQHRVLVAEPLRAAAGRSRPMPRAEARFDGTPVVHRLAAGLPEGDDLTYVWQVLSYQAMEEIYLGQVAAGLETLRMVYDHIWHAGNAWSAGLQGNADSVYMTHPVAWAVPNALTGAALDVPGRTLFLAPRLGGEIAELRCPFFFPSFWARLDHRPGTGRVEVEVLRTFGDPITIERVVERRTDGAERVIELGPTRLATGQRLQLALGGSP
jgi:non-lysosomal glucosylceramidase